MTAVSTLGSERTGDLTDPAKLLERARELEPALRLRERTATLDRLDQVLASGAAPPAPPGRDWRLEGLAERAVDATTNVQLDAAAELVAVVLADADPSCGLAITRALMARARLLAWTGTDEATREADHAFLDVIDRCRELGLREWQGHLIFWRANTVFFQNGDPARAAAEMRDALAVLGPASPRRATVLTFLANVLTVLGEWDAVDEALDEAVAATTTDDAKSRAYAAWSRAHMSSLRGDALATERLLREAERHPGDWLAMDTGTTFLAEAADMLDRVGLREPAEQYLARASARDPDNEFVRQARATLLARSGDPWEALDALQELTRGQWLEKRLLWQHMLLGAWATFRAGRGDAGALAARALEQAGRSGGLRVAQAGEAEILAALAPLAVRSGSAEARALLLDGRRYLVWLFGTPTVMRADGTEVVLPRGRPAQLVRMLAVHEHGLPVEVVLEAFFPEAAVASGRHRLRQVLLRLRNVAADLVVRDEDHLLLGPAWVDVRAFRSVADRVRATPGVRGVRLAYAALAASTGPLLPTDVYSDWAQRVRDDVECQQVAVLDRIVDDATARGSRREMSFALQELSARGLPERPSVAPSRTRA